MAEIIAYVAALLQSLANYAAGLVNQVVASVGTLIGNLVSAISSAMGQIVKYMQDILVTLSTMMNQLLTTIQTAFNTMMNAIVGSIQGIVNQFKDFLNYISGWLVALIRSAMDYVKAVAEGILSQIATVVKDIVANVRGVLEGIVDAVKGYIKGVLDLVVETFNDTVKLIQKAYEQLVTGAESIIATIGDRLGQLKDAFADAAADLAAKLAGIAKEEIGPIKDSVEGIVHTWAGLLSSAEMKVLTDGFMDMTSAHSLDVRSRAQAQAFFTSHLPQHAITRSMFFFLAELAMVVQVFAGVAGANAKVVLQEFAEVYSYELLSPPDVIAVLRRGLINQDFAVSIIHKQGFTKEDATNMIRASVALPAPGDMLSMWHRGIASEAELNDGLKHHGFGADWTDHIKKASTIHPPVQDLITMAVRDVFSPGTVARFQQMEGFPEDFAKEAEKAGLDTKWAHNYWAAHWRLPSAEQGFEMFQRGVIQAEDLDLLLKSLDIMPFWRDRLKQISYNVLTRVDVRRMHKVGVLTDDELQQSYEDIGYSPADAQSLAAFTIELNTKGKHAPDAELGTLTKATILDFYEHGAIDEARAIELLVVAGYTPDAAQLLTNERELKVELQRRRDEIDHIVAQVKAGTLTASAAGDKLNALNLEQGELRKAESRILRASETKVAIPSRTEGEKMVQAKIITVQDYKDLLALHGYASKWVEAFVKLLAVKSGVPEA